MFSEQDMIVDSYVHSDATKLGGHNQKFSSDV